MCLSLGAVGSGGNLCKALGVMERCEKLGGVGGSCGKLQGAVRNYRELWEAVWGCGKLLGIVGSCWELWGARYRHRITSQFVVQWPQPWCCQSCQPLPDPSIHTITNILIYRRPQTLSNRPSLPTRSNFTFGTGGRLSASSSLFPPLLAWLVTSHQSLVGARSR